MTKNIFLLLGGNKLNFGILEKFKKLGYLVYVVDWNEHPQLTGDKHYKLDVKDYESIIEKLKEDKIIDKVAFAYSSIDLAVTSVAQINKAIGLKTINNEALKYTSSKSMQTIKWAEAGILNKISLKFEEFNEKISQLNKEHKIIIKPDNSASSRGISIISKDSNIEEIKLAFEKAKNEATNKIVVVEEFVEGTEYTVEMIGDDFNNVCVYAISKKTHTNNTENNRIAVKLHYNAVSNELQNKIAEFGIKCYKALGFSNSLGHLEVIVKNDGTITPVEIGARSSGFIASNLVDVASGASFLEEIIRVQNGGKVENGLHIQSKFSSMYFFYDFPDNLEIKKECSLLDFVDNSIISLYQDRKNITLGRIFDKIDNDNARLGFEILKGPKEIMTEEYINKKEQEMLDKMFGRVSCVL